MKKYDYGSQKNRSGERIYLPNLRDILCILYRNYSTSLYNSMMKIFHFTN